ncbi:MAG: Chagasin family peptidase inhibitor [Bacteroidota bacterium]
MPKSDKKKAATREVVQVGCTTQLTLTRGQILTLKLPATAGTGYLWLLQKSSNHLKWLQSDVLKFEKTEKAESGKVGFAQSQVLTLEALEVGEVSLDWVYVRPTDLENIGNKCLIKVIIQE